MKRKLLALAAGATLLAAQSTTASAHTDVYVGLDFGIPAPVVVERYPVYYTEYEPAPVYYYEYEPAPRYVYRERTEVRYYERDRHDHGRHRGHRKHWRD